ncbi:hypothetical protein ACWFMI_24985 [Nocardiopsis terrae]|uniref:hypothetical protein n=1 Tax=Streptomyces sp. NPDC057554 TaxID=3350538 RepID=UPI0036C0A335
MPDQPTITGLARPTEPDLRHHGNTTYFILDSPHDPYALVAAVHNDGITLGIPDEEGDGTNTTLTPAQATLAATELLRINGANLAEFYVAEGGYPALYHVPPGDGEGAEGHLVTFTGGDHSLLDLVNAATNHTCEDTDE